MKHQLTNPHTNLIYVCLNLVIDSLLVSWMVPRLLAISDSGHYLSLLHLGS